TFIVMATRGHKHDIDAARAILNKDYKYAGMLGSRKKTLEVKKKLLGEGFSKEKINQMYLPIGLDISDGSVEEIGIAVMAEILKVKNDLSAKERRLELED
ncbi:MAG: XdhC/CoxF family protein, partial [Tissierellia bacterium]|nr:XdhC/CoxF family protein [Tissierellia bacterium]